MYDGCCPSVMMMKRFFFFSWPPFCFVFLYFLLSVFSLGFVWFRLFETCFFFLSMIHFCTKTSSSPIHHRCTVRLFACFLWGLVPFGVLIYSKGRTKEEKNFKKQALGLFGSLLLLRLYLFGVHVSHIYDNVCCSALS